MPRCRLLRSAAPPDAMFCVSDPMALGAIDAARYDAKLQRAARICRSSDSAMSLSRRGPPMTLTTAKLPLREIVVAQCRYAARAHRGTRDDPPSNGCSTAR
jgi:DNA-binding LacI/PurR family transcriptional regulator